MVAKKTTPAKKTSLPKKALPTKAKTPAKVAAKPAAKAAVKPAPAKAVAKAPIKPAKVVAKEKEKPSREKAKASAQKLNGAAGAKDRSRRDDDDDAPDSSRSTSSFPPPAAKTKGNGKSKQGVAELISLGKKKGFLTYDDVNEALPPDAVQPDQIDDVLSTLDDEDIEVVDDATNLKIQARHITDEELAPGKPQAKGEEEAEPAQPAAKAGEEDYYKSNDPVRMYLRKMGSVSLLTREGEVEIAKRIEEGENEVLGVDPQLARSPCARSSSSASDCKQHKIRVKDIVRDAEDEEHEFDEEEADRRIIRLIEQGQAPRQEAPRR